MKAIVKDDGVQHVVLAIRMTKKEWDHVHSAIGHQNIKEFAENMKNESSLSKEARHAIADAFLEVVFGLKE